MIFLDAIIFLIILLSNKELETVLTINSDWETIETLAEEYPYVVAILNIAKEYVCTGTVINKRTVLTSGGCINPEPPYVTVGTAVFNKNIYKNNVFDVAFSKLHEDYIFDIQESDLSISQMHNNIGLIFTVRPFLDFFLESANIGNYFASELKGNKLLMVGYGQINDSEIVVVQQQTYHQIACKNPKWYYCVCGIEYSDLTYEKPFGEGAPVLYKDVVVGIAASPSGTLSLDRNINYNIFTVIAPYVPWIEKSKLNIVTALTYVHQSNSAWQIEKCEKWLIVIIMIIMIKNSHVFYSIARRSIKY